MSDLILRDALRRRPETIATLDGMRAVSIACVLLAHLAPLGPKPWRLNENAGAMGMSLFFALSGFLIVRTLAAESVGEFAVKRLSRIVPLAYLYIVCVAVVFGQDLPALVAGLRFTLNYQTSQMIPVTEHLWSLSVEVQFYAAMALLALLSRRALWLVWPACLLVTLLRVQAGATLSIETHLRVDEILAGACVATLPRFARGATEPRFGVGVAQGVFLLSALCWVVCAHSASGALQYLRPYAAGLLLAAAAALPRGAPLARILSSSPARLVARLSYALYILHPLTAHGWWNEGGEAVRYLVKRPLCLATTALGAYASSRWLEQPCIRAARRFIAEGTAARSRRLDPIRRQAAAE